MKDSIQIVFDKSYIDITRPLVEIIHPTIGNMAILGWAGIEKTTNNKIRQPAIWLDNSLEYGIFHLSYEGYAVYMSNDYTEQDNYLDKERIIMPDDKSIFQMKKDKKHFFNNYNSLVPNYMYALDKNNTSINMNNISIFNSDCSIGCMINLRSSFIGSMDKKGINGNIIISCTSEDIG